MFDLIYTVNKPQTNPHLSHWLNIITFRDAFTLLPNNVHFSSTTLSGSPGCKPQQHKWLLDHRIRGADLSFVVVGRSFTVAKGFVPLKKTEEDNSSKIHQLYHFLPTHAHTLGFQVFMSESNCNVEIPQFLSQISTEIKIYVNNILHTYAFYICMNCINSVLSLWCYSVFSLLWLCWIEVVKKGHIVYSSSQYKHNDDNSSHCFY